MKRNTLNSMQRTAVRAAADAGRYAALNARWDSWRDRCAEGRPLPVSTRRY
jgi:hypothetical protein